MKRRYATSEMLDKQIAQVYLNPGRGRNLDEFCRRVMRPRWWVSRRAAALGLRQVKRREPPWSDAEMELLEKHAHKSLQTIARIFRKHGYTRTETAIQVKRKREGLGITDARVSEGIYTARQLAYCMGVDPKTVTRWIEQRMLHAKPSGIECGPGNEKWEIRARDVKRLMMQWTAEVDLRKCDKFFLVDVLTR